MKNQTKNNAHRQESGLWRTTMIQQPLSTRKKAPSHAIKILGILGLAITTMSFIGCGNVENRAVPASFSNESVDNLDTDVAYFRDTVWTNILKAKGCDGCHKRGGSAENIGAFADDSVAHSYNRLKFVNDNGVADASSFVDVENPAGSRMVTKVAGSHSCWTASCANDAQEIVNQLNDWANKRANGDVNNDAETPGPVVLEPPPENNPQGAKPFPTDPNQAINNVSFANTVYPLLRDNCSRCHTNTANVPQTPYFAHSDINTAYTQLIDAQKVDINSTNKSRIYERLVDSHNCWSGSCAADSAEMLQAINDWSNSLGAPQPIDPNLITSKALKLTEGQVSSGGVRFEQYVIAKYEFKAGSGNVIEDVSNVQPTVDLQLFGNYEWLGGWGIEFKPAVGNLSHGYAKSQKIDATKKLHDRIVPNNQYSIEAWVIPDSLTQGADDPAMIFSYGAGASNRNFGVGQKAYQIAYFNRINDPAGSPDLLTDGETLKDHASQLHLVLTYDPVNGRQFYLSGELIPPMATTQNEIGELFQWDLSYLLSLGGDTDNSNPWLGKIRLLAIHNRALTQEQVKINFDAGVGQKFNLLFSLSGIDSSIPPGSYMWFEVSEIDSFAYQFGSARFINLNGTVPDFTFKEMRLGINGREPAVGQAYARLGTDNTAGQRINSADTSISAMGTVIAKDLGVQIDQFFLTFKEIAGQVNGFQPVNPDTTLTYEYDATNTKPYVIGMRTFEEIHTTMSQLTGIPKSAVNTTYLDVKRALPVTEDVNGFLSSHQMAVTSLALAYCSALVDDANASIRSNFFTDVTVFDSNLPSSTPPPDTGNSTGAATINSLATDLYNNFLTTEYTNFQPALSDVVSELTKPNDTTNPGLYERLDHSCINAQGNAIPCTQKTRELVAAMCMGVLGSAAVSIQ